ncbi:MAG: hypothetical protein RIR01_388 [Bacteroidota bacterium]
MLEIALRYTTKSFFGHYFLMFKNHVVFIKNNWQQNKYSNFRKNINTSPDLKDNYFKTVIFVFK